MQIVPEAFQALPPRPFLAVLGAGAAAFITAAAAATFRLRGRVPARGAILVLAADALVLAAGIAAGFRFRIGAEGAGSPIQAPPPFLARAAESLALSRPYGGSEPALLGREVTVTFEAAGPGLLRPRMRIAISGLGIPDPRRAFAAARDRARRWVRDLDAIVRTAWLEGALGEADALRALAWPRPWAPEALRPRLREAIAAIAARHPAEGVREAADALARALRLSG